MQLNNHIADDDEDPFVDNNDEHFDVEMAEDETTINDD